MELTNIREIFRNKDKFADKEVTIGGWVRSNRNSKNFGFIVETTVHFLSQSRLYTEMA